MIVVFVVLDVILATERLTLGRNSKYGLVVSSTPEGRIEKSLKPKSNPTRGSGGPTRGAGGASRGGRRGGGAGGAGRVTIKGRLDSLEESVDKMVQMMASQQVLMQQMNERLLNIEGGLKKSNELRESEYHDTFRMLEVSFAML